MLLFSLPANHTHPYRLELVNERKERANGQLPPHCAALVNSGQVTVGCDVRVNGS